MGLPFGDNVTADGEERVTRKYNVTTVAGSIAVDAEDEQQAMRLARGFKGGASVISIDEVSDADVDASDEELVASDPYASEHTALPVDDAPSGVDGRQAGIAYSAPAAQDFEGPVGTPHPASDSPADGSDRREGI